MTDCCRRLAAFVLLALAAPPLWPCAPSLDEIAFWYGRRPGTEIGSYLDGKLGVLDRQFGRYYLFVAYRYLSGLGLSEEDQDHLAELWSWPPSDEPIGAHRWLQVRNAVPGVEPMRWISTEKSQRVERHTGVFYAYYRNCLDDAFETAAATLERYLADWGAESREARSWLEAQDQVFANCGGGESVPEPLDGTWGDGLREDRLYQIAAAHFYAGRYEEAREDFGRMAADPSSARRPLAHYLLGRILIREDRLAEADAYFRALVEEPEWSDFHASARGLLDYIGYRLEPARRRRELAPLLTAPSLPETWRQDLIDDLKLLEPPVELAELGDEMAEWIRVVGWPSDAGRELALARWEETRTLPEKALPWLVAALVLAEPSTPGVEALIQAGAAVPESSPAFLTSSYHRYRLLAGLGRLEGVRGELDQLLASQALSPSDRNRFQALRAALASGLDEYLGLTQQVALELVWDGGYLRTNLNPSRTLPLPELVDLMNRGLTTAELIDLVRRGVVVPELRRRILLAAWTRALVLGDDVARRAAQPLVRELVPELSDEGGRGGLLQALETASDDERPFVAALGLLRLPGLHPDVHLDLGRDTPIAEIDNLRANWWCPGTTFGLDTDRPLPGFVDPDAAAEDRRLLRALPAGPIHLGRIVIDWADRHREDPRVPEALHRVVRATRFGCPLREGGYGEISRQAFERLHRRYPGSTWAAKTKYWFE